MPDQRPFIERLRRKVLVCDGAMGTMLFAGGVSLARSPVETNLWRPDMVRSIHGAYVEAGADIIQTNTFGANRVRLAQHGAEAQVGEINRAGVRIAREARDRAGADVLIAGSVSPATIAGQDQWPRSDELRGVFREQLEALALAGVDLLVLETFGDLHELCEAVAVAQATALPIVAQLTFADEVTTLTGTRADDAARALEELGVSVIGANCTLGPLGIVEVIRLMSQATALPLSAQPNAGLPTMIDGHFHYPATSEYFARFVRELVSLGAAIVGGCCGTTPRHIAAVAATAGPLAPVRPRRPVPPTARPAVSAPLGTFEPVGARIAERRPFVACKFEPADDPERSVEDARRLRDLGIHALALGPARRSRAPLSPLTFALLARQQLQLDTILTISTLGRSAVGLQAELLGAHALGVRTVVCQTSAPRPRGDYPRAAPPGEVEELRLIELLAALNRGADSSGVPIGHPTSFTIGGMADPVSASLERELDLAARKVEAGAGFLVLRPTFDLDALGRLLEGLPDVPVIVSVMPVRDLRHAEYLSFEVPEVRMPEPLLERFRASGDHAGALGIEVARDMLLEVRGRGAGLLLVPSTGTVDETERVLRALPG